MNMSTYKRVDQMAHLKQKRISDDSCRAIVIDTIMESVRPLTKAELAEEISALFHILISPTRLNDVISDLLNDGIILFNKSDYIEISPAKEYDFLSAKLSEEQLRENATKLWLSDLRLSKDIPDNLGLYLAQAGAVDKVSLRSALPTKKDALWRHPACFIIRFRFNAVADKRQWSSAASKPRRKTRAKLCSRFCAENEPSHQTCRSFSASRYSGLERRSRLRCRSAAK